VRIASHVDFREAKRFIVDWIDLAYHTIEKSVPVNLPVVLNKDNLLTIWTNQPTNSVALVREQTISTERPPLVGELLRIEGCRMVSAADPLRP
jgi:hypothetical protein